MSNRHNNNFDPTKPVVVSNPQGGPNTEIGKAISSRNSIRHGCCADTLILQSENLDHYKTLEATWVKVYSPKDDAERHLIQELVNADWFLQRSTRAVAEVESRLYEAEPNQLNWTEQQHRSLSRFLRYQTTRSNTVNRCRKAVEHHRKSRQSEKVSEQKRITAQTPQRKNNPEPTWKEHLEGMRQKALSMGFTPPDPTKR